LASPPIFLSLGWSDPLQIPFLVCCQPGNDSGEQYEFFFWSVETFQVYDFRTRVGNHEQLVAIRAEFNLPNWSIILTRLRDCLTRLSMPKPQDILLRHAHNIFPVRTTFSDKHAAPVLQRDVCLIRVPFND